MKTIFVGNLAATATEVELRTLFETFGVISGVDIARGQDFAYIRMADSSEAIEAIRSLHGTKLYGKDLEVREARTPDPARQRTAKAAAQVAGKK